MSTCLEKTIFDFDDELLVQNNSMGMEASIFCEMARNQIPIQSGFVITSNFFARMRQESEIPSSHVPLELFQAIQRLEITSKRKFSDHGAEFPLLLSLRFSKTEIVDDSVVDYLGLNDNSTQHVSELTGNKTFALKSQAKLLRSLGTNIFDVNDELFDNIEEEIGGLNVNEEDQLQHIIFGFKSLANIPDNPWEQLSSAIKSLESKRFDAIIVRSEIYDIFNNKSGSGTIFTRNPSSGERKICGEFYPFAGDVLENMY